MVGLFGFNNYATFEIKPDFMVTLAKNSLLWPGMWGRLQPVKIPSQ